METLQDLEEIFEINQKLKYAKYEEFLNGWNYSLQFQHQLGLVKYGEDFGFHEYEDSVSL